MKEKGIGWEKKDSPEKSGSTSNHTPTMRNGNGSRKWNCQCFKALIQVGGSLERINTSKFNRCLHS